MEKLKEDNIISPETGSDISYTSLVSQTLPAGLSILDKDLRIVWVNTVQEKWFGPLAEIKGKYCYNIYEKRKKPCPGCPSIKVLKHGMEKCISLRRYIPIATGEMRHFRLTATPIRDTEGKTVQVLELVEDVTEEIMREEKIKKRLAMASKEVVFLSYLDRQFIDSDEISLENVLKESVGIAPTLLDAKMCNIRLINGSGSFLISRASKGLSREYIEKAVLAVGESIVGKAAEKKRPIIVNNVFTRRGIKFREEKIKEGIKSFICAPILSKKELLGTITVYNKKAGLFNKEDSKLLFNFANHVAILIDNVRIHKKILASYVNTIKALVSAVEARDSYTRGHSEKVTKLALEIASNMGLPKSDRVTLSYSSRLHDIGKIGISDLILNKTKELTAYEKSKIKKHPLNAVNILSNLKFLEAGIPAIKHHHERYDGRGYPEGLKGNEIPLLARIIGCADAFDAMTSDRAYRPRIQLEEALKELETNKGKQFDPAIVEIFVSIVKNKKPA